MLGEMLVFFLGTIERSRHSLPDVHVLLCRSWSGELRFGLQSTVWLIISTPGVSIFGREERRKTGVRRQRSIISEHDSLNVLTVLILSSTQKLFATPFLSSGGACALGCWAPGGKGQTNTRMRCSCCE